MTQITATTKEAYKLIHKGALAFGRAERQGFRIDVEYCEKKKEHLSRKIVHLQKKLEETKLIKTWKESIKGQINTDSNHQLAHVLYNVMKITPPKTTKSGKGATDEDALTQINLPGIQLILQIRKLRKMRDTYLDAFLREQTGGYIHPFFNLHTVRTYRSSSDRPNFQNIPKRDKEAMQICRRALFPRPGHQLLAVDFSGIEVMIAACYHKDPTMLSYLEDPHSDMHGDMAHQIFVLDEYDAEIEKAGGLKKIPEFKVLRNATKNGFVFPQFYGDYYGNNAVSLACEWGKLSKGKWKKGQGLPMPDGHLSDHLIKNGIKSFDQFTEHMKKIEEDFWDRRFAVYGQWRKDWVKEYQKKGFFDMHTGFRCKGVMSRNEVCNYPIQGAAFHCLLWSFIEVDRIMQEEQWDSRLIGQIHDEMLLDVHPDELEHVTRTIQKVTCQDLSKAWPWIITPLEITNSLSPVDCSWGNMEDIDL